MDDSCEADRIEDIMLPGFRFHPTDEELVGFYLKRKIQQRPLQIELIKQVDIYKYDPWDLPKLASTGEKEWYFYCPRDRKYRNSARPNRVTGSGFWKATGTDRPIYSSEGTHCIGLKKSLVFYRGRAARGMKTDWMMHEFRLPSISDPASPKKFLDKKIPANDAWAICRIFKKTNSMAQRGLSHSWVSPIPETTAFDMFKFNQGMHSTQFSPDTISCSTDTDSVIQKSFFPQDIPSVNPKSLSPFSIPNGDLHTGFIYSPLELSGPTSKNTSDVASMLFNISPTLTCNGIDFGGSDSMNSSQDILGYARQDETSLRKIQNEEVGNSQWGSMRSIGFPFSLPSDVNDAWKPVVPWDSPSCASEMSTTYSK